MILPRKFSGAPGRSSINYYQWSTEKGYGHAADSPDVGTACPGCGGTGSIRYPPGPDWYAEQEDACWECEGTGRALDEEDSHDGD